MSDEVQQVKVGQVWESKDKRQLGRRVRVRSVDGPWARCVDVYTGRATMILIRSNGYSSPQYLKGYWLAMEGGE